MFRLGEEIRRKKEFAAGVGKAEGRIVLIFKSPRSNVDHLVVSCTDDSCNVMIFTADYISSIANMYDVDESLFGNWIGYTIAHGERSVFEKNWELIKKPQTLHDNKGTADKPKRRRGFEFL